MKQVLIKVVFFLLLLTLPAAVVWSEDFSGNGTFSTQFLYNHLNSGYMDDLSATWTDMQAQVLGNFYMVYEFDMISNFYFELLYSGLLTNLQTGAGTQVAPFNLAVNQAYVQVPLGESAFITLGKRIRKIGLAELFNISNRISPRYLYFNSYSQDSQGLAELNLYFNDYFSGGTILYFNEISSWDKINLAPYLTFTAGAFALDTYCFIEEFSDVFLGWNLSGQASVFTFYLEGLLKSRATQSLLVETPGGSPSVDFTSPGDGVVNSIVAGVNLGIHNVLMSLEYLFRQEGLADPEVIRYVDYLESLSDYTTRMQALQASYAVYGLYRNYLGININVMNLFVEDLSCAGNFFFSLPSNAENFADLFSGTFQGSLNYVFKQNFVVTLFGSYNFGGSQAEFNVLNPSGFSIGLIGTYGYNF